ncbi:MAG TPA: acyl-CoA dehydrogenase, partial [Bacteroidetes bacterium]|nr:acyl-CoA dehydrogenase [Bacteroidota bacterium]
QAIVESGWVGAQFDYKYGGMNMPHVVAGAIGHVYNAANNHVPGYLALTVGAANLITSFGSQEQVDQYVPNMLAAKWMGTMCLTEPEAGSSLGNLRTTASPNEDGSYSIKGQKIFISGGDHQFAENFVHMVLARIDGAPQGTRGISLFIVPKFRTTPEGGLEPNDVLTAGDYQKMGQKGYCTAHLMFGENDNCKGWLVGEPNKGLKYMFQMMNQARLEVGLTAASISLAAYYHSLEYAKERVQGKRLSQRGEKVFEQTEIINHPDVRRMLLMQKATSVGALSLIFEAFRQYDLVENSEGDEKNDNFLLLDLLTPLAKAYPTEAGIQSTSNGIQVLGGYGFTVDFPQQQFFRDIRITSIYEGTTTIQSLDLLGRKVTAQNGKALLLLMEKINQTIAEANKYDVLKEYADDLGKGVGKIQKILEILLPFAFQKQYERYLKDATMFLEMMSLVVVSWQWLKIGIASLAENDFNEEMKQGNILAMKYYFEYELPKIEGLFEIIRKEDDITLKKDDVDYIN